MYAALAASALLVLMLAWVARLRHNLLVQEEHLLHAQKLESIGRLAGGVAHDFNNYLTVVLGYTTMLVDELPDELPDIHTIRTHLRTIRDVGEKTASLTRQLLAFSRKQALQPVPCDVNEVINDARSTLLPLIGEHIEIVMRLGGVEPVSIDPAQFLQVLVNLAVNARDAMPSGGQLIFETETHELAPGPLQRRFGLQPGRYVSLTVRDTGVGMDRATRQRIFEPFFTTKGARHGTGLGLAVVFGIVKQSKGHIEVQSKPGQGARFRIYLPVVERSTPAKERTMPTKECSGSETILVVEDQEAVRELVCTALRGYGYVVFSADGPQQALAMLADLDVSIDMLLTDMVMPEMSGRLLAAEAAVKRPGIRILFMSGYSEEIVANADMGDEQLDSIEKPFTSDQLAAAVRTVLDRVVA
jgi:nitrogen-specific signal transduction histidine kinase/CheY-like chemotaxis protein